MCKNWIKVLAFTWKECSRVAHKTVVEMCTQKYIYMAESSAKLMENWVVSEVTLIAQNTVPVSTLVAHTHQGVWLVAISKVPLNGNGILASLVLGQGSKSFLQQESLGTLAIGWIQTILDKDSWLFHQLSCSLSQHKPKSWVSTSAVVWTEHKSHLKDYVPTLWI